MAQHASLDVQQVDRPIAEVGVRERGKTVDHLQHVPPEDVLDVAPLRAHRLDRALHRQRILEDEELNVEDLGFALAEFRPRGLPQTLDLSPRALQRLAESNDLSRERLGGDHALIDGRDSLVEPAHLPHGDAGRDRDACEDARGG
jgi:hypothetical protein